jgi:calcineurin-like phosphoesterase family protein
MRHWTSDLHFGHRNILEYCEGRQTLLPTLAEDPTAWLDGGVAGMDEALIARWNETVAPDDDVMIVGDLCMGKLDESLALVPRLYGNKKLIPGNHDRCWEFARNKTPEKAKAMKDKYTAVGLEIWPGQSTVQIGKYTVLVCHFPYRGDSHDEDRFLYARPFDEGRFLLCGHVHDSWLTSGKQINVGVDVWDYKPVPDAELIHLIEEIEAGA